MYPYNAQYKAAGEASKPDKILTGLLLEAMADEATDMRYYEKLQNLCIDSEGREVIRQVHMDEKKHLKALTDIYQMLTGEVPAVTAKEKPIGNNPRAEYEKSVFNELEGMEFYRKLYCMNKSPEIRDMLFEILTDEQAHAIKMEHLFAKG